ncbi:hypothetical protein [Cellulomonas timonensis]|uniref:hypothetical protein n=1 Tax=Cellulomonas timonensis TaxID=1689271 RepID=UPI0008305934|nr:hypothetical protein [Cellulomonas timonensis]
MPLRRAPRLLAPICLLVLLEAALLVGLGVAFGVEIAGGSLVAGAMIFLIVFALGVAAVLVASARGLWRGRRWARSPVLTWQLFLIVLAAGWFNVEPTAWAAAILVIALAIGVGLMLPSVVAATTGRGDETASPPSSGR